MPLREPSGIVVTDPIAELVAVVRRVDPTTPDVTPSAADRSQAALIRRRFGVALPPPFAEPFPDGAEPPPVRPALPTDAAAISAVKWRAFGVSYRGVLPDDFLDHRDVVPPPGTWVNRATRSPSRRHALLVWGRRGEVHGYVDVGPTHDADLDGDLAGEVRELYVDPASQRRSGGARLLEAGVEHLVGAGLRDVRLWVMADNHAAQAFYAAQGWAPDGASKEVDLGRWRIVERRMHRARDRRSGVGRPTSGESP